MNDIERLRDQVDALKADLALATAREAALRAALASCHERLEPADLCLCGEPDTELCEAAALLADPSPAAERLLRVVAAARAWRDAANKPGWDPVYPAAKALREALADMEANRG